jgi:hypothetical protein
MSHLLTLNQSDVGTRQETTAKFVVFAEAMQNSILFFEGQMSDSGFTASCIGKDCRNA